LPYSLPEAKNLDGMAGIQLRGLSSKFANLIVNIPEYDVRDSHKPVPVLTLFLSGKSARVHHVSIPR
jgi:hypothetical protein